jgi:hypothetical protein
MAGAVCVGFAEVDVDDVAATFAGREVVLDSDELLEDFVDDYTLKVDDFVEELVLEDELEDFELVEGFMDEEDFEVEVDDFVEELVLEDELEDFKLVEEDFSVEVDVNGLGSRRRRF